MELLDNYQALLQENYHQFRNTKRVVEREVGEIKREMEEIEKEYCFLTPDYSDIRWTDENAAYCYDNLGKTLKYLKISLDTLKNRMAILN